MKMLTISILATELALGIGFIIKGEINNRRDIYRGYERGKALWIIGVALLFAFVSTLVVALVQ